MGEIKKARDAGEYCAYCAFDENNKPHRTIGINSVPRTNIGAELMRVGGGASLSLLDKLFGYVSKGRSQLPETRYFLKVFAYISDHLVMSWASFPVFYCPMCGRDLRGGE